MGEKEHIDRYSAVLLIGPTGAGKTPLGDRLEQTGLWGKYCLHFDFGANLREVVQGGGVAAALTDRDREIVRRALATGALLENENFVIAEKILRSFAQACGAGENHLLVLNGMPRHVGQAHDVDRIVDIRDVIVLDCSPDVVGERIRTNAGGDRDGRGDDAPNAVAAKMRTFRDRTLPLLDHYRLKGVRIDTVAVDVNTTPEEIILQLEKRSAHP